MMVREFSEMVSDVSNTPVDNILTDHLEYAKICASEKLNKEILNYHHGVLGEFCDSDIKKI